MKTRQIYYIIIVILIVIILWHLFKSSNENFICSPPNYSEALNTYKTLTNNISQKLALEQINCYKNNSDLSVPNASTNLNNCNAETHNEIIKCIHNHHCKPELENNREKFNNLYNDLQQSYKSYKNCFGNLYCPKKYMIPALAELESAYKNHTNNPNILGSISNNVTCETNFFNNDLLLSEAQQELSKCLSEYTKCDWNCKQEMYNMQNQYTDIQNAINNLNSPVIGECINNY
jgi:hypothetical protein